MFQFLVILIELDTQADNYFKPKLFKGKVKIKRLSFLQLIKLCNFRIYAKLTLTSLNVIAEPKRKYETSAQQ
jgi:hypothetical protein